MSNYHILLVLSPCYLNILNDISIKSLAFIVQKPDSYRLHKYWDIICQKPSPVRP